jgi:hypothetical protein
MAAHTNRRQDRQVGVRLAQLIGEQQRCLIRRQAAWREHAIAHILPFGPLLA